MLQPMRPAFSYRHGVRMAGECACICTASGGCTDLAQRPDVQHAVHAVGGAVDDVAEAVARAVNLLAGELHNDGGVLLEQQQVVQLHVADVQQRGVWELVLWHTENHPCSALGSQALSCVRMHLRLGPKSKGVGHSTLGGSAIGTILGQNHRTSSLEEGTLCAAIIPCVQQGSAPQPLARPG